MTMNTSAKMNAFFDAAIDTFINLSERWKCEKEYENVQDYAAPLQRIAETFDRVTITSMSGKPFQCTFMVDMRVCRMTRVRNNVKLTYVP